MRLRAGRANASNYSLLNNLTAINASQVASVISNLSAARINSIEQNLSLPYGSLQQNGSYVRAGRRLNYLIYDGARNLTYYNVSVKKAVPNLAIIADGVSYSSTSAPLIIHYPVINGKTTYSVSSVLNASLLPNNTAQFSYTINGNQIAINGSSVNRTININNIPTTQNTTITFDTNGNQNYTAVDPSVTFVPTNIVNYIPVTLTNPRAVAYPANAQINVTVNAGNYQKYEVANLINAEWFYLNGTVIPSWLQGNTQNQGQNSLSASNTVEYWLLISGSNNFLSASAVNTVYLGWAGTTITTVNTLMTGVVTGEAPELAPNPNHYGALDNGANVFILYQNFKGTSIPAGWTNLGTLTIDNGIGITGAATITNTLKIPTGNIIEANFHVTQLGAAATALTADGGLFFGAGTTGGNVLSRRFDTFSTVTANEVDNAIYVPLISGAFSYSSSLGVNHNFTVTYGTAPFNSVIGVAINTIGVNTIAFLNGTAVSNTATDVPAATTLHIEFFGNATATAPRYYFNWTRVRHYPPNSIMVSATFPSAPTVNGLLLIGNPNPPEITNTVIDVGQYAVINTIVSNGVAPYLGAWFYTAPNTLTLGGSNSNNTISANILVGTTVNDVLTVNAYSSTNVVFTFNAPSPSGIANQFYANMLGVNTVYGTWSFNTIVEDSSSKFLETTANSITINPALSTPTIIASNTPYIDTGQTDVFTASVTGGSSTYTYNFNIYNSITNVILGNQLIVGNAYTSNSYAWLVPAADAGNTVSANVVVTDSGATTAAGWLGTFQVVTVNTIDISASGSGTTRVAINPSGTLAYVTHYFGGTVNVINLATNTVINTIDIATSGEPFSVAFNPAGTLAYVTEYGGGTVNVINVATNTVVNTIDISAVNNPRGIAFNPSGTLAYITEYAGGTVNVINVATNTVVNTIDIAGASSQPSSVAFTPDGTLAYIPELGGGTVNVINVATNTVINTIGISSGSGASAVAFTPSGTLAYVVEYFGGTVNVINVATNTVINTIDIAPSTNPQGIAINPAGTLAYVAQGSGGTVNVINVATNTVIGTFAGGLQPYGVAINPARHPRICSGGNRRNSQRNLSPAASLKHHHSQRRARPADHITVSSNRIRQRPDNNDRNIRDWWNAAAHIQLPGIQQHNQHSHSKPTRHYKQFQFHSKHIHGRQYLQGKRTHHGQRIIKCNC